MVATLKKTIKGRSPQLNIALVGPITPYRGGIAQYTVQLHEALAPLCRLQTFSFKRLYPAWLYPGKSDKEPGMDDYRMPGVDYAIDIYSPLSLRKTADKIANEGCDVAIITWWTLIWQPGLVYMARRLRRRGVKVVFLCHILFDHEAKGLKQRFSKTLLKQADAYIVQTTEHKKMITEIKPGAPILQRLLPDFGQFPGPNKKLEKRGSLEILFFGFIRPYKGLDTLVDALARLNNKEVYLTVVGEVWGDVEALRQRLLGAGAPNLELHLEYVDNKEAANYFARADIVALPYVSATGSGVLALAYHYYKPVLATRIGGLPDGVIEGKTGWLVAPNSSEELAKAISDIDRKQLPEMENEIKKFRKKNSWENMGKSITEFITEIDSPNALR